MVNHERHHTPPKTLLHGDPNQEDVFCHFPPLFRLYDREGTSTQSIQHSNGSTPLQDGRLGKDGSLVSVFARKPGAFHPSRLVRSNGKVEVQEDPGEILLDYIVISYTWGRWMKRDRNCDTALEGCYWKVPSTTMFSRQELDKAVRTIAGGRNFWLDVFCIPQDDKDPEKAQEISRQGDIFLNATGAAVWLSSGGEGLLQEICSWMDENGAKPALDLEPTLNTRLKDETIFRFKAIQSLPEVIPWTTSLWTLQETALRRDAVFHAKNGLAVLNIKTGKPIIVEDLVKVMTQIETDMRVLRMIQHCLKKVDRELFQAVITTVDSIALGNLDNMTTRDLYLASKRRVCQRDHDRVYAIMNALGVLIPVNYSAPVKTVHDAFILELYNTYPAEMQSFLEFISAPEYEVLVPSIAGIRSRSLSQMRQLLQSNQLAKRFISISSDGYLTAIDALRIDESSVNSICHLIKEYSAVICYDDKGQDRLMEKEDCDAQQRRTALNLGHISRTERIVLISLGRMRATIHTGPTFAYLLCLQERGDEIRSKLTGVFRIGLLVSKQNIEDLSAEKIVVAIKHDLSGGEGTSEPNQSSTWLCDKKTPLYLHPPWSVHEGCHCLPEDSD